MSQYLVINTNYIADDGNTQYSCRRSHLERCHDRWLYWYIDQNHNMSQYLVVNTNNIADDGNTPYPY